MSISKFVMVGGVKLAGATARGMCSVAYAAGNDVSIGFNAACVETERQVALTRGHIDKLNVERETRIAAAKLRHAQAKAAAVAAAAPMAAVV